MRPVKPDYELMETEILKLRISPSFRRRFDSNISREDSGHELPRYTSLKDIIYSTSPQHPSSGLESGNTFDSSNISIRNELVKHAASVYVQSATIPTNRNEDWVTGIWERMRTNCVGFRSCWDIHVREPLEAVGGILVEIFCGIIDKIRTAVRGRSVSEDW